VSGPLLKLVPVIFLYFYILWRWNYKSLSTSCQRSVANS